jgi:hypothetical protein
MFLKLSDIVASPCLALQEMGARIVCVNYSEYISERNNSCEVVLASLAVI